MTIDLGGIEETVKVYKNDDPHQIAFKFCQRHGLGNDVCQVIKENIIKNIISVQEQDMRLEQQHH